ncbi:hypothetical protein Tco_0083483 [Tanacetum coccineum]
MLLYGGNKPELEDIVHGMISTNIIKVYEPEFKGTSSSNTSTQNMAFVSSNNSGSTNEATNTAHEVFAVNTQVSIANSINVDDLSDAMICAFFFSQLNNPQLVNKDLQQLHPDEREGGTINGNESIGFDKSKVRVLLMPQEGTPLPRNCRTPRKKQVKTGNREKHKKKRVPVEEIYLQCFDLIVMVIGDYDWSDQVEDGPN